MSDEWNASASLGASDISRQSASAVPVTLTQLATTAVTAWNADSTHGSCTAV